MRLTLKQAQYILSDITREGVLRETIVKAILLGWGSHSGQYRRFCALSSGQY